VSVSESLPAERGAALVVTVEEAGRLLGISRGLAYGLVAHHELPHVRLGRRIVIPRTALEALLNPSDSTTGDRSAAYELVIEDQSYRRHQKPTVPPRRRRSSPGQPGARTWPAERISTAGTRMAAVIGRSLGPSAFIARSDSPHRDRRLRHEEAARPL